MNNFIKSFDDIVGHKNIVTYLRNKLATDTVPNIIIFNGASGIGKTSIAKCLAVELNALTESKRQDLVRNVIDNNVSTDCIKMFNMSSLQEGEIDGVVSEIQNVGLSSTGKKVLILDEAHGMTDKEQESILVELEYLDKNIYVFFCTTEMGTMHKTLVSRTLPINLYSLNRKEIIDVISRKISVKNITFDKPLSVVINLIAGWADNQPRKAINLIDAFEENTCITTEELSLFIDTKQIDTVRDLIQYFYSSITLGLDFIENIRIDENFNIALIEVLKVGLGHTSNLMSKEQSDDVKRMFVIRDIYPFLQFAIDVSSKYKLTKTMLSAMYIKHTPKNKELVKDKTPSRDEASKIDMKVMGSELKQDLDLDDDINLSEFNSLDAILSRGKVID